MKKKKTNAGLFIAGFVGIFVIMVISNVMRQDVTMLKVSNKPGVSGLETVDRSLVCTFQDGRIVIWDWNAYNQTGEFKAFSDRVVILDPQHLGAVSTAGQKMLTVYSLPAGQKQKDLSVGWDDQTVRLRISSDKSILALIRENPLDAGGRSLFEFFTVDIEKEILNPPTTLSILRDTANFIDYDVANSGVLLAVGSKGNAGRITVFDLDKGAVLRDTTYPTAQEFCSVMMTSDAGVIYAGSRNGILYKMDTTNGEIIKKIQLLQEGETRSVTNDYSVLNLAFSPDGQYFAATINPKVYILKTDSDEIFHTCSPADRLVSKVAFSPDNMFFATSDIRAGYPVKIWPMPKED